MQAIQPEGTNELRVGNIDALNNQVDESLDKNVNSAAQSEIKELREMFSALEENFQKLDRRVTWLEGEVNGLKKQSKDPESRINRRITHTLDEIRTLRTRFSQCVTGVNFSAQHVQYKFR